MEKSDHCIHPARKSVKPPKRIVDQNGKAVFGTFESEFETLNLLDLKHPTAAPDLFNRLRLTLWEAMEVNLKEGVLLAAICDMGLFGKILNVFWDRRTNRIYRFEKSISSSETGIAPCLIGRTIALARTDSSEIRYVNEFEHGRASVTGRHRENHDELEYDFQLEKICEPSIVSIPFGKNRPLYSEKVLFKVKGSITVNGEKMTADEHTTAIIDDHRGYYPRKMHYDWVTSMGLTDNGYLGVNLTRNQSEDQNKYNENLIWKEDGNSLLPPVRVSRTPESRDFSGSGIWHVRDDHHMVNVDFIVRNQISFVINAGLIKADYYISFGELKGWVRQENGRKIVLDGMVGIGEDKSMNF